jgi:MoxR-like ATPase
MAKPAAISLDAVLPQAVESLRSLRGAIHQVLVGQEELLDRLMVGLLTSGHVLIEGVPGLAKSLAVSTLAQAVGLHYQRIQFTPDLLPADLIGTLVYNAPKGTFEVKQGPIFTQVLLADEINRAPAKVQSALLEAMQERQVTIGETTFALEQPFWVLATQNPLEQEGTYPLPEAQLDRFLLKVQVDYPTEAQELEVLRRMARTTRPEPLRPVLDTARILQMQGLVNQIMLSERLEEYIVRLVRASRKPAAVGLPDLARYVDVGSSPRGVISLALAARAYALLNGRGHALPEDVKALAPDVLNHRMFLSYEAEADGITGRDIVRELLAAVPL